MPIYEYRCQSCGEQLEVMQHITDDPLSTCPSCGGDLQKLISNTSFILKGTGWYATDYAKKDTHKAKKKESEDKSGSSDKSTSSSDKGEKKES